MSEHPNLDFLTRRLPQRALFVRRWTAGQDVVLGGVVIAFLITLVVILGRRAVSLPLVYAGLGLVLIVAYLAMTWRLRASPLEALARADLVLQGQERLSTAYEYLQQAPANVFLPALLQQADRLAARVDPSTVFPVSRPRRLWGVPIFLLATIGLHFFEVRPLSFDALSESSPGSEVMQEGKRLEEVGQELETVARQENLDRSLMLARHLQHLGKRLQQEGGEPRASASNRIATLADYLQRLQQELRERALMSSADSMTVQDVMDSGKSLKQELQELSQLLQQNNLSREMRAMAEQTAVRLRYQLGQNAAMDNLLQNLRAGDLNAARQLLRETLEKQQASEELEQLERARRALEYSSRAIQRGQPQGQTPQQSAPQQRDTPSPQAPGAMEGEMMSEEWMGTEGMTLPGSEAGSGTARRPEAPPGQPLRESNQPVSKVEVPRTEEGPTRLSYMRYLPMYNDPQVAHAEVATQYRRAAEEMLTKEEVPRAYREQIKQYFLSLGMMQ